MSEDARKADARRKIGLGGIVIKAGLGSIDAMALLGLLLEHRHLITDPGEQQRFREIGRSYAADTARDARPVRS
jgi:hypothetical protein